MCIRDRYNAAKYAERAMTEALRLEEAEHNVRVVEIAPGLVHTPESVSYTHLDVYKRQHPDSAVLVHGTEPASVSARTTVENSHCLLYTSRCV